MKNVDISPKMDEFLDKVDALCFEYGYQIYPTEEGWTGKVNEKGEYDTFAIIDYNNDNSVNEVRKVTYIDGGGRGK